MTSTHFAVKNRWIVTLTALGTLSVLFALAFADPAYQLGHFHFNLYVLISAATLIFDVGLFIYFVRRPATTEDRVWLSLYLVATIIYVASELMQRLSAAQTGGFFWSNASTAVVVVAPAAYLFALAYTNQSERRYPGIAALLLGASLLYVFFMNATSVIYLFDAKLLVSAPWGWDAREGTLAAGTYVAVVWYYVLLIAAAVRLFGFRRKTRNPILRKQSLLFAIAVSVPILGGAVNDLVLPSIGVILPSFTGMLTAITAFMLVYGIVKYRLLTISPTLFSGTILDIMSDAVVVTDSKFHVLYTNPQADILLEQKAGTPKQIALLQHITEDTLPALQQAFARQPELGEKIKIDHVDIMQAHADPVPVRIASSLLKVHTDPAHVMILTDITDELHTRSIIEHEVTVRTEQLNQARAYLVSSINSLEQGFILVNRNSMVELANGVAGRLFQSSASDVSGKQLIEFIKPMPWNVDLADIVHKVLDARKYHQLQAAGEDGTFYEIYVTPVLASDRELGATIIIQDITEQKILDRSKDEFFSLASHELRTPLTAIRGNMSMVQDYFPAAMKDQALADMVNDTHDASVRLIEIVTDFLDSSKLEQGKMQFAIQPVAIGPLVKAVQGDLKMIIERNQDTITLEGLDKLPKVAADEGRLRQILYNLLSNALTYSDHASITISGTVEGKKVLVRITDTGKGISPENQKLLFHKFQQAGKSLLTRDDTKGTGLGLYISRLLAEHMHGSVELEHSEEGKGSTFVVTLPVATATKSERAL